MTKRVIVTKEFNFHQLEVECVSQPDIIFPVNTVIDYERWAAMDGSVRIAIKYALGDYSIYQYVGADFPIEDYVSTVEQMECDCLSDLGV